jgi:sugar/nucleoside kinase (ribokinase family)
VPRDLPFDVVSILNNLGVSSLGLVPSSETALIEWILYEEDGNRQSLPRNPSLRDPAADMNTLYTRYLTHIANISPSAEDIPSAWLPAKAIHLAPQVMERHRASALQLAEQTGFLSLDPSPHYCRGLSTSALRDLLPTVNAFLPSQAEVQHLGDEDQAPHLVTRLAHAGFPEVVLKRGGKGCLVAAQGSPPELLPPASSKPIDFTGAGDAFSGAYATNRAMGHSHMESAMRATISAAMIIECFGTEQAFKLEPADAERRLKEYRNQQKG